MIKFKADPLVSHVYYDAKIELVDRLFFKQYQENSGFNRRMFDEDFSRIFHYSNNQSNNIFEISSNDEEFMSILFGCIHTRNTLHDINQKVLELVTDIAKSLICYGEVYFFIKQHVESSELYIFPVDSNSVVSLFGKYIQWLPQRINMHDDQLLSREIRFLDSSKVIRFVMPISIKHMLSAQNKTLSVLDQHKNSEISNLNQSKVDNYFNFTEWNEIQELALYRATRFTGWNCRKYDSSKRSDFFKCHRLIRFRRNQLVLRDSILNQLSNEFSRIGKAYNPRFFINVSSSDELPSVAFLNELEAKLVREEVSFNEIIDYCYQC